MRRNVAIETRVPENDQVLEGPQSDPESAWPRWFREGINAYEGQKQAASDIGVDPAYLRRQLAGAKPVNLAHLDGVRHGNVAAFRRIVESMAFDAQMVVVSTTTVKTTAEQRAVLLTMRDLLGPQMWPAYRDKIAARVFRCGGDLLDAALDYEAAREK